jgi:hypothetical protein
MDVSRYDQQSTQIADDILLWCTVLLTHSDQLREFTLRGISVQDSVAMVLVGTLGDQLTTLKIDLDSQGLRILRILPCMTRLRSLLLTITAEWENDDARLNLRGIPPLIMPNLTLFSWVWWDTHTRVEGLQYLADCRFKPDCKLGISFQEITADEMSILNPLLLAHHSKYVSLSDPVPSNSTVLMNSRSVRFKEYLPPINLLDTADLPAFISFEVYTPSQVDDLWALLDVLVKSTHTYNTFIYIWAAVCWSNSFKTNVFIWERAPDFAMHEKDLAMGMRLIQYSRILTPKGITLGDGLMRTCEYGIKVSDVSQDDVYMRKLDLQRAVLEASPSY